MWLILILISN